MVAAILTGGFGTRLQPVLSDRPKGLAPVRGRPFLELILDQLEQINASRVVLCTGYLGDQIQAYLGERRGGLELIYSREDRPLGTAGALRLALPHLSVKSVLVLNGDSYYRGSLGAFMKQHHSRGGAVSVLLSRVQNTGRYGRVELGTTGEISRFVEKDEAKRGPGWVNAGIYLIETRIIESIDRTCSVSLEREVFPSLIGRGIYGHRGQGDFIDIGTPEALLQAGTFVAGQSR